MKREKAFQLIAVLVAASMLLAACGPAPTPVVVEKEKVVEKPVVQTVVVEKEKVVEKPVVQTVVVEKVVAPTPTPRPPTQFVFAHGGPIRTMDAPVTWYGSTHWLTNLLYDCLIWRHPTGAGYVGQAAEKWETVNPTTWRFHLRKGLTFHNGEPLDANAVKWNIDRVRTRKDFMVQPQWEFVKDVIVVDDLTVDITTEKPHAYFEYDVSYNGCELLPPKYIEQVGEEEFAKKPVGSGPYKLVEMIPNEKYVFEAWDGYWAGRPEVDRVIYQVIPEKASQIAALLAGQVDLVAGVPLPDVKKVAQARGIVTMEMTSGRVNHLYLRTETESGNMAKKYPGYQPATLDKRIRHAISYALDRNLLADVMGSATPIMVRLSRFDAEALPGKYAGAENAAKYYDPEKAKALIKEAGYDPDAGKKPKLYFDAPAYYFGNEKEIAEAIKVMLEDVGFEVELTILDRAAHFEQIVEPGNNRDLLFVTLGTGASLVPLFYMCDWWEPTYHVCDPEWDKLSAQIMTTVDANERLKLWDKWWEFYLDYAHTVTLHEINNIYAMNEKFEWTPRKDGWMTFRDLKLAK
ncbi:MAG: ABC transporter substrate-binding protein [Anaerolineae bacterium]